MPKAIGPFQIIEKFGDDAFKMDLPEAYGIFSTFDIGDLTPFLGNTKLRTIPSKEGGINQIFTVQKAQMVQRSQMS